MRVFVEGYRPTGLRGVFARLGIGRRTKRLVLLGAFALSACATGSSGDAVTTVAALNGRLLAAPSATETLEGWCADRHLAPDPRIVARRGAADKPADAQVRAVLQVSPTEPVRYRQVKLVCGTYVLSEADNWYVAAALTPAMNQALDASDTPFGKVVAPLNFTRKTLSVKTLVTRKPAGPYVLEHRAVLSTDGGTPFSLVIERYTSDVLAKPPAP